jgi:hypothetical protein
VTTLETFVDSIESFNELDYGRQNELLVFFLTEIEGSRFATASQIDDLRMQLSLHSFRTAQDLSERSRRNPSGQSPFIKLHRGYGLERKAAEKIRATIKERPSRQALAGELKNLLDTLQSGPRREYLVEALGCFQANHLRAAVVLTWCVSYDVLRDWLFSRHAAEINKKTQTWRKPLSISRIEDFGDLTDRTVIDLGREIRALTKEEHKIIVGLLDRRNSYAHPTGRSISPIAVEAFLEENVNEVVKKYGP